MSVVNEGYYQDRYRGVTISVKRLSTESVPSFEDKEILRAGNNIAIRIENNSSGRAEAHDKILAAARKCDGVAVLSDGNTTYVFGPRKDVLDFLMPPQNEHQTDDEWRQSGLIEPTFRTDLEALYNYREESIKRMTGIYE